MSFEVKNLALSALSPVKFTYSYNSTEKLLSDYRVIDSGLQYYNQKLLTDCVDGAFSQNTALILTDVKDIKTIFESVVKEQKIDSIGASFYLSVSDTDYLAGDRVVTITGNNFFVGGRGAKVLFNASPIKSGVIELKYKNKQVIVSENYPYNLELVDEPLEDYLYRQQFEIEIYNNKIALKTSTKEGTRYLSYGIDRQLRFIGIQLNDTTVNDYLFTPVFISSASIRHNFDPTSKEVRYYNETQVTELNKNLAIKNEAEANTNLLVSCALKDIVAKNEVSVNIAITKTNFTTSGTFNTSI